MSLLVEKKKDRRDWFFLTYISILIILGSVGNATNIKLVEEMWVGNRNFPGGPYAYYAAGGGPYNRACDVAYVINGWLQDGMLVSNYIPLLEVEGVDFESQLWRFWMFFTRNGRWHLAVLPGLMFLSVVREFYRSGTHEHGPLIFRFLVFSLTLLVMLSKPIITLWSTISIKLGITYWTTSIALNIIITTSIVARLLYMRHQIRRLVDLSARCIEYLSLSAMLVEFAALYTINGGIFLVSYALNSPLQGTAFALLGQTMVRSSKEITKKIVTLFKVNCSVINHSTRASEPRLVFFIPLKIRMWKWSAIPDREHNSAIM
jgi:hypothetical protein